MKSLKSGLIVLGSVGLLFLGACSSGNQSANPENSSTSATSASSAAPANDTAKTESSSHNDEHGKNAQVVEAGGYHLEFVPEKEANSTHMDLFLQKGDNHQAIPNAKVTAQVQLPDGTQKTLPLTYDATGKHYTAALTGNAAGQYQVKVTADVSGKKVDGRFNFNR